jgi:UDP-glucose:(heptosyl)LPS alpha-1,3-glucosyltransferase
MPSRNIQLSRVGLVRRGYSSSGGAESYTLRLAKALADEKIPVSLYVSTGWPEPEIEGIRCVRLQSNSPDSFSREFARVRDRSELILSMERVIGCDVYRAGDGVHAAWLDRRSRYERPFQSWWRGFSGKHRQILRLEASIFRPGGAKAIIANSKMVRDEILKYYPGPPERVFVVPNGYDVSGPEQSREVARKQLGLDSHQPVALFAGSGWERKGLRFVLEAVRSLSEVTLLVAGKGQPPRVHPERVRFLGPRKDLPLLFAAADVFVLPTLYDPFSNACLEALAHGLPVITTPGNGFSEIVTPVIGTVLSAPEAVEELAGAILKWSCSPSPETRLACLKQAGGFSVQRNLQSTLDVLRSVQFPQE